MSDPLRMAWSDPAVRPRRSAGRARLPGWTGAWKLWLPRTPLAGRLLVAAVVLVLGVLALRTAWAGVLGVPMFLLAGLGGLVGLGGLRRIGVATPLVLLAGLAVPLLVLAVVGRAQDLGPADAITRAFPILLTSQYPAPATPTLLGPGVVIAWVAGAILGFGLGGRRFTGHLLASGVLLLVSAELLTAGASDGSGLVSAALTAVLLAYWAGGHQRAAGMAAASAVAVLAFVGGFVPLGTPFQPRDLVHPPSVTAQEPNPLPMLAYWAAHPDEEILRRSGATDPLHLVVLPDYNGVTFESVSEYVPLGSTRQPTLPAGRFQKTVQTTVTWTTTMRWIPAPGMPTQVSVPGALVDVETGSLISPDVPRGGEVSYSVSGRLDAALRSEVAGADIAHDERYTAVPDVPPEFVGYAREVTDGAATYLDQALALERALKADRAFDPGPPGGSSYGRLEELLFAPRVDGGRAGTSEQFATAYAVLARAVGLPTRVVLGFGAGEPLPQDPSTHVVRGRDALAWPEVYFAGFGWVPFNPTPDAQPIETVERSGAVESAAISESPSGASVPPEPPALPVIEEGSLVWTIPIILLLILLGGVAALVLARTARTRRLRGLGAVGAWLHIEDAIRLAGLPSDPARTARDRAAALGVPEASALAAGAEAAAFAPGPPTTASDGWEGAEKVVRRLRVQAPIWRRVLWKASPTVWRQN